MSDKITRETPGRTQVVLRQLIDVKSRVILRSSELVSLAVIIDKDCLVTAHSVVRAERAQIDKLSCRRVAHSDSRRGFSVVCAFHVRPHHKLSGLRVIDNLGTLKHLGRMEVVRRVISHSRKHDLLKLPVYQICGRVARYSPDIRAVTFPSCAFRKDSLVFLILTVPIVFAIVVHYASPVGIDRIARGV